MPRGGGHGPKGHGLKTNYQLSIATQAALSRRKPIQDAQDCWKRTGNAPEECGTEGPGSQTCAIAGTDLVPRLGSTDTCVAQGNPSYT
jgi:hypothetical protein